MRVLIGHSSAHGSTGEFARRTAGVLEQEGPTGDVFPISRLEMDPGRASAFDTRVKAPALVTGRASHTSAKALRRHRFELLAEPEGFLVTSTNHLMPEEEARARQWGVDLAAKILSIQP